MDTLQHAFAYMYQAWADDQNNLALYDALVILKDAIKRVAGVAQ